MFTSRHRVVTVVLALVVAAVGAGAVAGAPAPPEDDEDSGVVDVAVTGEGAATVEDDTQFVWRDAETDVVATVVDYVRESDSRYDDYWVRLTRDADRTFRPSVDDSVAAAELTLRELEQRNVTLSVPADELSVGTHELHVSMYEPATGGPARVNETTVTVRVARRSGDVDGDGLRNADEVAAGTELLDEDTDDDGLRDGVEVHVFGSDPTAADSDDDGVADADEVQNASAPGLRDGDDDSLADLAEILNETSPSAPDSDLDGLPDPVERELGTDANDRDTDGDGIADGREVLRGSDPTEVNEGVSATDVLFGGLTAPQRFGADLARALTTLPGWTV